MVCVNTHTVGKPWSCFIIKIIIIINTISFFGGLYWLQIQSRSQIYHQENFVAWEPTKEPTN